MIIDITTENNSMSMSVDIANIDVAGLLVNDAVSAMDKYLNTGHYVITVRTPLNGVHQRYVLYKKDDVWHRRFV